MKGYFELAGPLLVTLGVFPALFNKVLALNYATPIVLVVVGENGIEKLKSSPAYQQFLFCFHLAIAISLWADASVYSKKVAGKDSTKED